ncbi:MAG: DUF839 domain-containing protein, partial [Flavobacteriaceae bacterium]|nr:DUF839 domain-containing protein [Flavobacteriaceae bacterium]
AVKNENQVYRFQDSDPITGISVIQMETYVGNTTYNIEHTNGSSNVDWDRGNDNLAFDGEGNLWVMQDGGKNYIWVVENGHTQINPKVKIFGRTPLGSEPTGITFSPDYRFLFMSIQHPNSNNNVTTQNDAAANSIGFEKDISLVVALNSNLGTTLSIDDTSIHAITEVYPNPVKQNFVIDLDQIRENIEISVYNQLGMVVLKKSLDSSNRIEIDLSEKSNGIYFISLHSNGIPIASYKLIKKN